MEHNNVFFMYITSACCVNLEPKDVFLILMLANLGVELSSERCLLKYIIALFCIVLRFKFFTCLFELNQL